MDSMSHSCSGWMIASVENYHHAGPEPPFSYITIHQETLCEVSQCFSSLKPTGW